MNRLHAQMQAFVSESKRAAELEEKRRYRFLAEKHLLLSNTFLQFLGRVSGAGESKPRPPQSGCAREAGPRLPSPLLSSSEWKLISPPYFCVHLHVLLIHDLFSMHIFIHSNTSHLFN